MTSIIPKSGFSWRNFLVPLDKEVLSSMNTVYNYCWQMAISVLLPDYSHNTHKLTRNIATSYIWKFAKI